MSELYNRYNTEVIPGKGVKIHIEVFVEKWEDAVAQMNKHAIEIKQRIMIEKDNFMTNHSRKVNSSR